MPPPNSLLQTLQTMRPLLVKGDCNLGLWWLGIPAVALGNAPPEGVLARLTSVGGGGGEGTPAPPPPLWTKML